MQTHEGMINQVRAQIDQVPLTFLEAQLFHAYVEACQRSWMWNENVAISVPSTGVTPVSLTNGGSIAHIAAVIDPSNNRFLRQGYYVEGVTSTDEGDPTWYQLTVPDSLRVWPIRADAAPYTLRAIFVLQPAGIYTDLPEGLLLQGFDMFLSTVLARMYALPNRPWTSPELALLHGRRSRALQNEMRTRIQKSFAQGATVPWRYPAFA